MKYLPLYYKWMKTCKMPSHGLCNSIGRGKSLLKVFDIDMYSGYIGYDGLKRDCFNDYNGVVSENVFYDFTPLRQNIVLFMAAMNGEL